MIIALSGYARTGKDEVGRYLTSVHGFKRVAFADKMREAALALNPIIGMTPPSPAHPEGRYLRLASVVDCFGWDKAKTLSEVRRTLQRLGTDAGRNVLGEDVWVEAAMNSLPPGDVVITDCRFLNEAAAIEDRDGIIIRITRPGIDAVNAHLSETQMDGYFFPYTIENAGSIEDLGESVEVILADIHRSQSTHSHCA